MQVLCEDYHGTKSQADHLIVFGLKVQIFHIGKPKQEEETVTSNGYISTKAKCQKCAKIELLLLRNYIVLFIYLWAIYKERLVKPKTLNLLSHTGPKIEEWY